MLHFLTPLRGDQSLDSQESKFEFKIADCLDDWRQSFGLVYQCYLKKNLISPNPFRCRVSPYHLLPHTTVFIAKKAGEVVCTVSLIGDSASGLPLEEIYEAEIDTRRRAGTSLAEVSALACRGGSIRESQRLLLGTLKLVGQHAQRFRIQELVAVAHPKHAEFYIRTLGFREFGSQTVYPTFRDAPAIGFSMNFAETEKNPPPLFTALLKDPLPLQDLLPCPMPPEVAAYFQPMVREGAELIPLTL